MKTALVILGFLLPGVGLSSASPPRTPQEFIAACRAAYEDKSGSKLKVLVYTVGMSEQDYATMFGVVEDIFPEWQIDLITLEPLPADYQDELIAHGVKYESTSPPVGLIKTNYRKPEERDGGTASNHHLMPYTIVDGVYYLVGTKSIDLGWEGPPDKNIGFGVRGRGWDRVRVRVKWNASGIDRGREYSLLSSSRSASGSEYSARSSVFWGQHIDQVIVTSLNDEADIILEVLEEGETIFTSEPLKGRGTIQYQR